MNSKRIKYGEELGRDRVDLFYVFYIKFFKDDPELSLRGGGQGFPSATINVVPSNF